MPAFRDILLACTAALLLATAPARSHEGHDGHDHHHDHGAAQPAAGLLAALLPASPNPVSDRPYPGTLRLAVDATDLQHRIFRVKQSVPAAAGPLRLLFPRWLPGTHGPGNEIARLAGLQATAGGKPLGWTRDPLDPFAFTVDVPRGATGVELEFQFLSALDRNASRVVMTPEMLNLQWNQMLLYPAGYAVSRIPVQASVTLPAGWEVGSGMKAVRRTGDTVEFEPTTIETLVDSPLFAGRHTRRIALEAPGAARPVSLFLVGDTPAMIDASEAQIDAHRQLVRQADQVFASRHFRHYEFLLAVSSELSGIGLEHHESSENGVRPGYFKDWDKAVGARELLPHEYAHSWNGKFRRPAGLDTPHYHAPMDGSLLWLYEGQTQFWGRVLAARSGLTTLDQARQQFARMAASAETRAGRSWRTLQDTTNEGTMQVHRRRVWTDWERGSDYYDEAALMWLDVDTLLREKTAGARGIDDFARAFFGVQDGRVAPLAYTFDDIVRTLAGLAPGDWAALLRARLDARGDPAQGGRDARLLDGLQRAGWRLAWSDTPGPFRETGWSGPEDDHWYSLGIRLQADGKVPGVAWMSPAFRAGLAPGVQVMAVNGKSYNPERLADAVRGNREGRQPIVLTLKDGDNWRQASIDWRGGPRFPKLERVPDTEDRLTPLLTAR